MPTWFIRPRNIVKGKHENKIKLVEMRKMGALDNISKQPVFVMEIYKVHELQIHT